ncbi:MAG: hypothetical protein CVU66_00705 [Deltaproteobacteria bacterium HGW-Deltaproteobacteria-23]|nr:MAG: hypothetical protein CVU66_00705 [Deltaproteobacteria bacterium HGW-Deltaproteobacteria-23]
MTKVEDIANFFINKGISEDLPITPMKLQKLLYFAYGWYTMISKDRPLFNESFQAWQFGPVCSSIYHSCKKYRNNPITERIDSEASNIDVELTKYLEGIWGIYKDSSAIQLSNETHRIGTPWYIVTNGGKEIWPDTTIEWQLIKEYFHKLYNDSTASN